ncbi:MAG TPA: serine hydrolase domain-containing protein [Roseimicrobium sp.]|nr:serine hydrolase domain-containing protein [Roseimicrobium sp.]
MHPDSPFKTFGALTCLLLTLIVPVSGQSVDEIPEPAWLKDKLEEVRSAHGLPAMAAAVVVKGRIVAASAVGVRKLGETAAVTRTDRFHLGSIAKPISATCIAVLAERGEITWDMTLSQMFPELVPSMNPAYRDVTVSQLLAHVSGMPYQPKTPEGVTDSRASTVEGRRYEYLKAAVMDPPDCPPGTKVVYSGGPVIVASFLERKLKKPFETLMKETVFEPLEMSTAGFGSMASMGQIDGPWEHAWANGKLKPVSPNDSQKRQARSAVGRNIHCSVIDLARFAVMHLDGARGRSHFFKPETVAVLHTRVPSSNFAPGWTVEPESWPGKRVLWHNGSNGNNMAACTIGVERDFAVCVMCNAGGPETSKWVDEVQFFIGERLKTGKGQ